MARTLYRNFSFFLSWLNRSAAREREVNGVKEGKQRHRVKRRWRLNEEACVGRKRMEKKVDRGYPLLASGALQLCSRFSVKPDIYCAGRLSPFSFKNIIADDERSRGSFPQLRPCVKLRLFELVFEPHLSK